MRRRLLYGGGGVLPLAGVKEKPALPNEGGNE